ncbi:hypothetical protein ACJMK2_038747 [Sinanodonta woodiana]|uniref:Peptidase M12B domain-containing protein n=1 Tax=Sinanodonta woodiana TaxID=1069815 RepID=A0ABD3WD83_SINWO
MTVECARRSNGQCDRVLNGNIRTGGRNYDLRVAEGHVRSRNVWEVPNRHGKRYVLREQENIRKEIFVENKDASNVHENSNEQERIDLRHFQHRQSKQNHFPSADTLFTSNNLKGLYYRENNDTREISSHSYDVEIAAVIDNGIWELFWSLIEHSNDAIRKIKVQRAIRKFCAHIFNGVNLRYKETDLYGLDIRITLRHFVMFQNDSDFPHRDSKVITSNGMKYVDISKYLNDLSTWDLASKDAHPNYDHAMLLSRYELFEKDTKNSGVNGLAWPGMVCELGNRTSVVKASDYFMTVSTAAHELAHSLGAVHDGDEGAEDCKSEDFFIMSKTPPQFILGQTYSRNPWVFSECSVRAFKNTLKDKDCVKTNGVIYDKAEWEKVTKKLPGEKYSNNMQCQFILGGKSTYCGDVLSHICLFMECIDPQTGSCHKKYFSAARGTSCGNNMWCIEGRCVPK